MLKGYIPSVCLLSEFSNLQNTPIQTDTNTAGVGINLMYVDNGLLWNILQDNLYD